MSIFSSFFKPQASPACAQSYGLEQMTDAALDKLHGINNPEHQRLKSSLMEGSTVLRTASVAAGLVTAVFAIITLAFASVGALILTGLCGFVAYNASQLGENLAKISKIPASYIENYGVLNDRRLNAERLKEDLSKGTFGCATVIGLIIDRINVEIDKNQEKNSKRNGCY